MSRMRMTAVIQREGELYVALCPEFDVVSQGTTVEEAKSNLIEALELFLEHADSEEIKNRTKADVFVTSVEVAVA
ncbi:MAG: type II toxin-antitoxin system HicB family antitoxin [Fimbriimonadaceae bacterium]|nr:type II toxin-antitoxin system HicB family antitoxin [Fimbriimonadaceae bacterium]